jgi:hypothetical protein
VGAFFIEERIPVPVVYAIAIALGAAALIRLGALGVAVSVLSIADIVLIAITGALAAFAAYMTIRRR